MAAGDDDSLIGRTIDDRYKVRRLIGRGGMGAVYEAEHVGLGKRVAIKFLAGDIDADALARFRREARAAGALSHEHVVEIFDVGEDAGHPFIAMEYVDGRDLRSLIEAGPLSPQRVIAIARQILAGLAEIHAAGIVHRDIKPANLLLAAGTGNVKIMDFGISKSSREAIEITRSGMMVGTPQYMAPEQLLGGDVDHRADLYAVGLTLYTMLAGEPPFGGASTAEVTAKQLRDPPPRLDTLRSDLPGPLIAAIDRALAKAPADRFATANAFADALDADAREAPTAVDRPSRREPESPPPRQPESSARRAPARRSMIVLVLAAVVAAVVLAIVLWPKRDAVVATPDAAPAADPLAKARAAERTGKLELAIAHYLEAHATSPDAELLFRIGELYERMNRTGEAVAFFRRYLDDSPRATDRDAVIARIARLAPSAPSAVDAAVAIVPDAGVEPRRPRAPLPSTAPTAPRDPTQVCHCVADGITAPHPWLCKQARGLACRCDSPHGDLCPERFTYCRSGTCAPGTDTFFRDVHGGGGKFYYSCPVERGSYWRSGVQQGAACSGFSHEDIPSNPDELSSAPLRQGTYNCSTCRWTSDRDYNTQFEYDGPPGTPCTGYRGNKPEPGHVTCQRRR